MTPPSQHDRGQCLRDGGPHALCHTEVASLANPNRSAATSPVSRWPEAIRPVGEMKSCFCGGKYDRAQCQRDDCPRARLGYGSCHMALSKLWNVAGSRSGRNPVKLEPIAVDSDGDWYQSDGERLEVTQVEPSSSSQTSEAMWDMHISPISEVDYTPANSNRENPYVVPTQVWLMMLMLPDFSASCYLNDVVRLAGTSRMALEPAVVDHLALIQHLVAQHTMWHEDWCAEKSAELDLLEFNAMWFGHDLPDLRMCLTCGLRPGAEWLGHDECYDCYSEH